jgi:hypothetical protein
MMALTKLVRGLTCWRVVFLSLLILPIAVLAHEAGEGTTITVDGYKVTLVFPEQLKVGENPVHLQILDAMGMPVSGSQIEICARAVSGTRIANCTQPMEETEQQKSLRISAAAMGGMHGMHGMSPAPAPAETKKGHDMAGMEGMEGMEGMDHTGSMPANGQQDMTGEYVGMIGLSATGYWMLNTRFSVNGQTLHTNFPVAVVGSWAPYAILGGFALLNALIIWVAAAKRKIVSA